MSPNIREITIGIRSTRIPQSVHTNRESTIWVSMANLQLRYCFMHRKHSHKTFNHVRALFARNFSYGSNEISVMHRNNVLFNIISQSHNRFRCVCLCIICKLGRTTAHRMLVVFCCMLWNILAASSNSKNSNLCTLVGGNACRSFVMIPQLVLAHSRVPWIVKKGDVALWLNVQKCIFGI